MAISTYTELKASIADHLDDDGLTSQIDDFIDLAEVKHKQDIRIRELLTRETIIVNDRYIDLPFKFLEARTLRLLTDPLTVLKPVRLDVMNRERRTVKGKPTQFTVHEQIEFDYDPDQSYTGEMIYYQYVTPLSSSNETNEILKQSPAVYLYGALLHSAPFLEHDERIATWGALYTQAVDALNGLAIRAEQIGVPIAEVSGPTP